MSRCSRRFAVRARGSGRQPPRRWSAECCLPRRSPASGGRRSSSISTSDGGVAGMGAVTTAAMAGSATAGTKLRQFLLLFLAGTVVALAGMIVLPQDRYLRYQALNDHSAPQAYWIYERIHFDSTPIDVAFVGTSRTGR